jgi:hypothetical protein
MVFIPESEVFFACSAIVFKAFQRGPTKYFLQKKILFHVDLITTKNQIQSWPFIYKPGEHRQQSKGEKNTKLRAQ